MTDTFKKRGEAIEAEYFQREEKAALERLAKRSEQQERLSPVTGKPMVQRTSHGVVIDQCQESGGIWLDAGELEQIVKVFSDDKGSMIQRFFSAVLNK